TLEAKYPERPEQVLGDADALHRVFINLLDNAIKFTADGSNVTVRTEQNGSTISICIQDTGAGILPQDQPRLFERFWQGEPGKRYVASTGLGLYLCKQ